MVWKIIDLGYVPKNTTFKRYIKVNRPIMFPEWIRFFSNISRDNEIRTVYISNEEIRFITQHEETASLQLAKTAVFDFIMFSFLDDYTWRRILNNVRNRGAELRETVEHVYNICSNLREILNKEETINDDHGSVLHKHFRLNDRFVEIVSKIIELAFSSNDWASFVTGTAENETSFSDVLLNTSIKLAPHIQYGTLYETRQYERELSIPRGIVDVKGDVKRLTKIGIDDSSIVLELSVETGDSSNIESTFFLVNHASEVRIRDLILAHYVLTDEDWQWIYNTMIHYVRLSEIAKKKIKEAYTFIRVAS
jgi:hypothetical protein